jgi:hypothetical protein
LLSGVSGGLATGLIAHPRNPTDSFHQISSELEQTRGPSRPDETVEIEDFSVCHYSYSSAYICGAVLGLVVRDNSTKSKHSTSKNKTQ